MWLVSKLSPRWLNSNSIEMPQKKCYIICKLAVTWCVPCFESLWSVVPNWNETLAACSTLRVVSQKESLVLTMQVLFKDRTSEGLLSESLFCGFWAEQWHKITRKLHHCLFKPFESFPSQTTGRWSFKWLAKRKKWYAIYSAPFVGVGSYIVMFRII